MTQAALGDDLKLPTLRETVSIKIPPGTQPGQILRLRGKGLPGLRGGGRGDLLIRIAVEIPARLTAARRRQLEEFEKSGENGIFPGVEKFWEQLRRWMG